ncbi:MAG TPA: cupin domain-containing protein [Polyangiales bacterium]|nr:cupin domain-containing protein [Polyangiales bacterium]
MSEPRQPQEDDIESARLIAELDEAMASLLEPVAPRSLVLANLLAAVERPPQRYAPFYSRMADLFDLSEESVIAECTRLAEPSVWRFAGLPGVKNVIVQGGPRVHDAEVVFARFAPGLRFPRHVHTGIERVLVLEGSYVDSDGVSHAAGELREWEPGTKHGFQVSATEPCIIASVVFGRTFEALPLRLLARALGR